MTIATQARNANLADLAALLKDQQARSIDFVAPASKMRMESGILLIEGTDPQLSADGVTMTTGEYTPTNVFDEGLAAKLNIPVQFLRRMRYNRVGVYDAIANGLLSGVIEPNFGGGIYVGEPDSRQFLVRCFRGDAADTGVARAFLSDSYKTIDNFDALTAALQGVKNANVTCQVVSCDLSDRRMVVRVYAPEVFAYAPELLAGYRSPFTGASAEDLPRVFGGFEISNSEVGDGAFSITPRMIFEICNNGAKMTADALRAVHLGGKLDEGVIQWSEETSRKTIELVTAKAADAVKTFLDIDYMKTTLEALTEEARKPVDASATVQRVGKKLAFSQDTIDGVLEHFIKGGQVTAGGVMQAITSYAQTVDDAELAFTLEGVAVQAMALATR